MAPDPGQPPPLTERRLAALRQRYRLDVSDEWRAFRRHRNFCDSFAWFLLLAPELAAVELARRTLHDETLAAGGQWHQFFLTPATPAAAVRDWLLALPALPRGSAVWVSAAIEFTRGDPAGPLTSIWLLQSAFLNMQRDLIRARITCPLILAGPPGLLYVLRDNAPDLWSVRETIVQIVPAPAEETGAAMPESRLILESSGFPEDLGDPDLTLSEAAGLKDKPGHAYLRADLLRRAGNQLCTRQRWQESEAALKEAWAILEEQQALPETLAKTARGLALLYQAWGHYAESRGWMQRYADLTFAAYPAESHEALAAKGNLANLVSDQGDLTGAEPLYRRTLEAMQRTLGPEHPDTLISLNNLANLLAEQGDLAGAEPLYRRVLEARERTLGPEHPHTLNSLNNFAVLLKDQGDLAGAEPLYRRALEARERTLGPEHSHTLSSLNNLAILLKDQGDLAGAEPLFRRVLEAMERNLGPEHPHTLTSLNNLAGLLAEQGDLTGAEPLFRRALEAMERTLGPEHPDTLMSLNNLGALREMQSQRAEAVALYARAVAGAQKIFLPEHPSRKMWERNLARVRTGK